MDAKGNFTMDDMAAIDKFIDMVNESMPNSVMCDFPKNALGEIMRETIRFFADMMEIQRRIVKHEAEEGFDEQANLEGGL
jgi:hypothetical protein